MGSIRRTARWVGRMAGAVRRGIAPSQPAWTGAALGLVAVWAIWFLSFVVFDLIPLSTVERALGILAFFAAFGLLSLGLILAVSIFAGLPPRYRAGLFLALPPTALFFLLIWGPRGGAIASGVGLLAVSLACGGAAALAARSTQGWRRLGTLAAVVAGLGVLAAATWGLLTPPVDPNPAVKGVHLADGDLKLPDPGQPGPYRVTTFTYGSGHDRHRREYAAGVRFRTGVVDGSKLDSDWTGPRGWIRSLYWGFDAGAFPLQARVWMPDGPGPFPLVLIVHGNHEMERFSDGGYAYLGRHLASHGFITASVDENFLNSSRADFIDILKLRMGKENDARAWLLLEHLVQWRRWTADRGHPLFGKADMSRIALIGHSRGGEAVATANAFNRLSHYPDDATLTFHYGFDLRAIAAIAPVDGQYKPRNRPTPMRDTNYFTIQGSMDGDMTSFMGAAQYARDELSSSADAFKASLYVVGANHGQFNTAWGRNDMGAPFDFLLDERAIMPPTAQAQIAKVYLTAFLQAAVNEQTAYRALLQDARSGARWIPDGVYLNNYADGRTIWLATFDEDLDPGAGTMPGVEIRGHNLTIWKETYVDLKWAPQDTQAAILAWDERVHRDASYALTLAPGTASPGMDLVFSASSADMSTLPVGSRLPDDRKSRDRRVLDWTVVAVDAAGHEARLPLSHDQLLYPQVRAATRRLPILDSAKASEVVMRRFRLPLSDFAAANPAFDPARIQVIRFDFDRSPRGAIVLDDLGLHAR
jgi:dienelactone hydrolase